MIVTTYTCDRCDHSQEEKEQMWELKLTTHALGASYSSPTKKSEALWCRKCMEVYSLLPQVEVKKEDVIKPAPTIEDLVREITQGVIEENV